ncbi:MAG: 4-phosphoerythronate dehydrogenase [Parahaliea sp.]
MIVSQARQHRRQAGLNIVADENMRGVSALFSGYGQVVLVDGRNLCREQLLAADVLLVRSITTVDKTLLDGTAVRFVGTATSGLEHIDRRYLSSANIAFAHAQGANANSVLEYVLSAIACSGDYLEQLLCGAEVGIVGHGHVGRRLADCFRGLGIGVCIYDPWLEGFSDSTGLDEVLKCRVLCLHPELTRQAPWPSYHLLSCATLAQLPENTLLINASRGAVVDNCALLAMLKVRPDICCVLDVWEGEPLIDRQLLEYVDLATPHIAGYSLDSKLMATRMLADTLPAALGIEPAAPQTKRDDDIEMAATIRLAVADGNTEAIDILRQLLTARYDIRRDDHALRQALAQADKAAAGPAFDALRRHYPERRELRNSKVVGVDKLPMSWLQALGVVRADG